MCGMSRVKKIKMIGKLIGIVRKIRMVKLKKIGIEIERKVTVVTNKAIEVMKVVKI